MYFWYLSSEETETTLGLVIGTKLKIPYALRMMVVMRLMTYLSRKQLGKEEDLLIPLPVGIYFWKMEHHEFRILPCLLSFGKRRNWLDP